MIIINYLISNRAGSNVEYRYIVPDLKVREHWVLYQAFQPAISPMPQIVQPLELED